MWRISIHFLIFSILSLCAVSPGGMAEVDEQDKITMYLRGDIRNHQPYIVTLNGAYDWNHPWGTLIFGSRVGTTGGQFGSWSYKLEALTPEFLGTHRLSVRMVKNNYPGPSPSSQDTRYVERFQGSYLPFEAFEPIQKVGLTIEGGTAQIFSNTPGTNVLPNAHGAMNVLPIWALKVKIPTETSGRRYDFSYSNFDVFDPYPASQPFLQAEASQQMDEMRLYSYIRYRWDYSITNFYSLYFAIGAELPN
jgi:hypothetical protein